MEKLFKFLTILAATALFVTACGAPIPTLAPATATEAPTAVTALPFTHTACAEGADLTGQTINLYQIVEETEPVLQPLLAGYEDATAYFNAHSGICGATIKQVYRNNNIGYDPQAIFDDFSARNPKPVLIALYFSEDAALLRDQFARDEIPWLGFYNQPNCPGPDGFDVRLHRCQSESLSGPSPRLYGL